MRNKLQAIYIKSDTSFKELGKIALSQLILKVIYFYDDAVSSDIIRNEINGILKAKINQERINETIELLFAENKIKPINNGFGLSSSKRRQIDIAHTEYEERHKRIIEKYFNNTQSKNDAIQDWFENITITFFTKFRSEWIAEKAYNVKTENPYDGLLSIVTKETNKNQNIIKDDRNWLISQYIKFIKSNDEDLISIFWDYGTCAYSSSLITNLNSANQITIDTIKNSKFILDTNILMYLRLEEGKYYNSYSELGKIFKKLNIQPGYFYITRDEYLSSISIKKEDTIRVIEKYEDSIVDGLNDDFIKTAIARQCDSIEDYQTFFDQLLDMPKDFTDDVELNVFDSPALNDAIEKGTEDETLIDELNTIFINRHKYNNKYINYKPSTKEKGKSIRPLKHDAGLIRGAEFMRTNENCFILTREISVKQYGIIHSIRDTPFISIGLDTLISLLAIDSGGIEIDPGNFKPLFAKIIKLALFPEKGTFQIVDLVRMLDIEQNISELPDNDIISIAKEMHKYQMADVDDAKVNVEITRKFQNAKMNLKKDLNKAEAEVVSERNQKDIYKSHSNIIDKALRDRISKEVNDENKKWKRNKIIAYFIVFPLLTAFLVILLIKNILPIEDSFLNYIIGFIINIVSWFLIDFFFVLPKIMENFSIKTRRINEEIEKRYQYVINNAT